MALRLEVWLGVENGGRADLWIGQQAAYDLGKARKAGMPKVQRAELMAPSRLLQPVSKMYSLHARTWDWAPSGLLSSGLKNCVRF